MARNFVIVSVLALFTILLASRPDDPEASSVSVDNNAVMHKSPDQEPRRPSSLVNLQAKLTSGAASEDHQQRQEQGGTGRPTEAQIEEGRKIAEAVAKAGLETIVQGTKASEAAAAKASRHEKSSIQLAQHSQKDLDQAQHVKKDQQVTTEQKKSASAGHKSAVANETALLDTSDLADVNDSELVGVNTLDQLEKIQGNKLASTQTVEEYEREFEKESRQWDIVNAREEAEEKRQIAANGGKAIPKPYDPDDYHGELIERLQAAKRSDEAHAKALRKRFGVPESGVSLPQVESSKEAKVHHPKSEGLLEVQSNASSEAELNANASSEVETAEPPPAPGTQGAFDTIDTDGSGKIDKKEFAAALLDSSQADKLFTEVDKDKGGDLDKGEWDKGFEEGPLKAAMFKKPEDLKKEAGSGATRSAAVSSMALLVISALSWHIM